MKPLSSDTPLDVERVGIAAQRHGAELARQVVRRRELGLDDCGELPERALREAGLIRG